MSRGRDGLGPKCPVTVGNLHVHQMFQTIAKAEGACLDPVKLV